MAGFCSIFLGVIFHTIFGANGIRKEHVILPNVDDHETFLTPEDFANLENFKEVDLTLLGINMTHDPTLSKNRFEGDIFKLTKNTIHRFINDSNSLGRAAVKERWRIWPDGEIPYALSSRYGTYSRQVISKAFDEFAKKTCVKFVPKDPVKHKDFVYIFPEDGCYSLVGKNGGRQPISLDAGCIQVGTVMHELMHASGFFHEQSRADRDEYIEIIWRNLEPNTEDQFEKYSLRSITHLGLPYDYGSIMHYGRTAFSNNGRDTIKPLKPGAQNMGQRNGFSDLDVQKLNKLYTCDDKTPQEKTTQAPTNRWRKASQVTVAKKTVPCEDSMWQCLIWKAMGHCSTEKPKMLEKCPKRCDFCEELQSQNGASTEESGDTDNAILGVPSGVVEEVCLDKHEHCAKWASLGYCRREGFADFVQTKCRHSCKMCNQNHQETDGFGFSSFARKKRRRYD